MCVQVQGPDEEVGVMSEFIRDGESWILSPP